MVEASHTQQPSVIGEHGLLTLFQVLKHRGYRIVGPTVRDKAIVYDDIASPADLPRGWTDEQDGGHYRLVRREDDALFGYAVGPQSWKKFLFPPLLRLWRSEPDADGTGVRIVPEADPDQRLAFLGVRACELHAIAIQDRIFLHGPHADPHYRARREGAVVIAVNCGTAGGTCFCVSMKTGPKATQGFDLVLTELSNDGGPRFLVEAGSELGDSLLAEIPRRPAGQGETDEAEAVVARAAQSMGREMRSDDVRELLLGNLEHARWDTVAQRCLTCGNCTLVCPTCFCSSVEDANDLDGGSTRTRRWDSCFTLDHSYIHGGSVRQSGKSRYRQWMTHKLATWIDQFGTSGCVGCGRCITWCPVGIDITEEVRAIRETQPNP
jgi:sulfhydrogenase subunit beta (sulfur reductase)